MFVYIVVAEMLVKSLQCLLLCSAHLLIVAAHSVCVSMCQVEELTAENTQLKERVVYLEKLLDIKKEDGQLLNKMVGGLCKVFMVLQLAYAVSRCV